MMAAIIGLIVMIALWKGVFDRWTSNKMPTTPRYKSRQAAGSSIQVGVFKCDLPSRKVELNRQIPLPYLADN